MEKEMENQTLTSENAENKYSRRSRSSDNRGLSGRDATERPPIVFGNISRFNLPESMLADKRYEFGWNAYVINNEEIPEGFYKAQERGWECVESSEYPQAKRTYKHDPFRKRESEDEFIKIGGQICMRRPIELKEAEDKYYDEENYHKEQLIDIHKWDSPGGTRVFSHKRTRESRARF